MVSCIWNWIILCIFVALSPFTCWFLSIAVWFTFHSKKKCERFIKWRCTLHSHTRRAISFSSDAIQHSLWFTLVYPAHTYGSLRFLLLFSLCFKTKYTSESAHNMMKSLWIHWFNFKFSIYVRVSLNSFRNNGLQVKIICHLVDDLRTNMLFHFPLRSSP